MRSHAEYVEGETLLDMIKEDLVAERIAIDSYREMITYVGNDDPTTTAHVGRHSRSGRGACRRPGKSPARKWVASQIWQQRRHFAVELISVLPVFLSVMLSI